VETGFLVAAFVEANGDPARCYDTYRQGNVKEDFHTSHHLSPPRVRLANKCSATAAKSQITVPTAAPKDSVAAPEVGLAILAAGAMSPATTQAVDVLSREFASSFVRSLWITDIY